MNHKQSEPMNTPDDLRKQIANKLSFLEPNPNHFVDEAGYNDAAGDHEYLIDELCQLFHQTMSSIIGEDENAIERGSYGNLIKADESAHYRNRLREKQRQALDEVVGK